jgi:hypothetical protein
MPSFVRRRSQKIEETILGHIRIELQISANAANLDGPKLARSIKMLKY